LRKSVFLFFFGLWFFSLPGTSFALAGGGGNGDKKESSDSTQAAPAEEPPPAPGIEFYSPEFDVFNINPSSSKSTRWDTSSLNMYGVDMNRFHDTLTYVLDDPRVGKDYVVPFHGRITSGFGYRRGGFHYGIDIDLELGDPVVAALDGTVRIANYNRGYGNMVVIAHDGGLETLYGHMSKLEVVEGQVVKAGQLIGIGGSTGRSTGAHLHLEFFVFGEQVNPLNIIDPVTLRPLSSEIKVDASWFDYMLDIKKVKYYEVEEGVTIDDIALAFEKNAETIAQLNGITVDTPLEVGRKILLE
jgi:murein DD-endopeptidase MepM/ murein hydrolase activator NlpD